MSRLGRHWLLVAAAWVGLAFVGGSALPWPPLIRVSELPGWWEREGPAISAVCMARVGLLIVATYWLVLLSWARFAMVLQGRHPPRIRLPGWSAALRLALGASAGGGLVAGCAAQDRPGNPGSHPPPVLRYLGPATPGGGSGHGATAAGGSSGHGAPAAGRVPATVPAGGSVQGGTPTGPKRPPAPAGRAGPAAGSTPRSGPAVRGPEGAGPAVSGISGAAATSPPPAATPSPSTRLPATRRVTPHPRSSGPPQEWIVRPGDDLWSIAATTLTGAWGPAGTRPNQAQTAAYWLQVIAANRPRLPDPGDPSLLFPGDIVVLPGIPPVP